MSITTAGKDAIRVDMAFWVPGLLLVTVVGLVGWLWRWWFWTATRPDKICRRAAVVVFVVAVALAAAHEWAIGKFDRPDVLFAWPSALALFGAFCMLFPVWKALLLFVANYSGTYFTLSLMWLPFWDRQQNLWVKTGLVSSVEVRFLRHDRANE
jgi:hypothetical protein